MKLNTPAQLALLKHMRREGKSLRTCAAVLGVSKSQVALRVAQLEPLAPRLALGEIARAIPPYGFVYVFAAQSLVKIGMTQFSVYRRWHSTKTANPWLERPLYVSPPLLGRVIEVERACHAALKQYRVTGEWFEVKRELAIETVKGIVERYLHE